jgi:hypothetical protein
MRLGEILFKKLKNKIIDNMWGTDFFFLPSLKFCSEVNSDIN